MIPEIERKIYERIHYADKILTIRNKYIDNGLDKPIYKKNEILNIFKELDFKCKYTVGGSYTIEKKYENYSFEENFVINKNAINSYIYIHVDGIFIDSRVTNMGSILRYIPYNKDLINQRFGLNSLEDLKNYIQDMIGLFDEFVDEYIKEIEAGNVPE